ncbi:DUF1127 domain-containing protein [Pseudodonghicola flavimaris]|nr:DUF1127 domain-containing protein [Pseudodonghicola flavimaris]
MAALKHQAIVQTQHLPIFSLNTAPQHGAAQTTLTKQGNDTMAALTHSENRDASLLGRMNAWAADVRLRVERFRVFRQTLSEMGALNNKELADLGLHRSELRRVAYQASREVC